MTKWKNIRRRQWDPEKAEQTQGRIESWNDSLETDLESNQSAEQERAKVLEWRYLRK